MTARRQWLMVGGAAALLLAAILVTLQAFAPTASGAALGEPAPAFTARRINGAPPTPASRTLESYRGRVVLLNFWATWCEPCKREMPSMEALHRDYASHGLSVVAMSEDLASVPDSAVAAYARDLELTFDILRDTARTIEASYQVVGYPTSVVIDRDGVVRRKWIGEADWNSPGNRAVMRQLLGIGEGR